MKSFGWLLAIMALLAAAACTNESQITVQGVSFTQEQLDQGQQGYMQYCASCHGADGEGQFPNAPNQPDTTGRIGAPPHNGAGHTWHHGDELLIRYVREGGMGDPENFYPMPAFGDQLSEGEIIAVLAYIKTMWSNEQRARQQQATEAEGGG